MKEKKEKYPKTLKELFSGTGVEEKTDEHGNKTWNFKAKKINIPNPAEKGCIIYVDNDGNEISRDYGNK